MDEVLERLSVIEKNQQLIMESHKIILEKLVKIEAKSYKTVGIPQKFENHITSMIFNEVLKGVV